MFALVLDLVSFLSRSRMMFSRRDLFIVLIDEGREEFLESG